MHAEEPDKFIKQKLWNNSTGELTANCRGPTMLAYCELIDHHDGRFSLNVKPQEVGKHTLEIKFGGEHVPGE